LSEHDDTADYVLDKKGNKLPDSNLRDSEKIPFLSACGHAQAEKQDVEAYFEKEIKPYYPVAWMDRKKDKVGYEINFTKYFYKYKPPRPIEEIEKDIKEVIGEIQEFLKEEL
jgi:type I restriction enzyme M protein